MPAPRTPKTRQNPLPNLVLSIFEEKKCPEFIKMAQSSLRMTNWDTYNEIRDITNFFQIRIVAFTSYQMTQYNEIPDITKLSQALADFATASGPLITIPVTTTC